MNFLFVLRVLLQAKATGMSLQIHTLSYRAYSWNSDIQQGEKEETGLFIYIFPRSGPSTVL